MTTEKNVVCRGVARYFGARSEKSKRPLMRKIIDFKNITFYFFYRSHPVVLSIQLVKHSRHTQQLIVVYDVNVLLIVSHSFIKFPSLVK